MPSVFIQGLSLQLFDAYGSYPTGTYQGTIERLIDNKLEKADLATSLNTLEYKFDVTVDGEQVLNLPSTPKACLSVKINGLEQAYDAYTIVGSQLTLPIDLLVTAGDVITVTSIV